MHVQTVGPGEERLPVLSGQIVINGNIHKLLGAPVEELDRIQAADVPFTRAEASLDGRRMLSQARERCHGEALDFRDS